MAVVDYGDHYLSEEVRRVLVLREPMTWMQRGACRGANPDHFFPEQGQMTHPEVLKNFCNVCPVKTNCLNFALDNYEVGIWGGTSTRQRKSMRAKMSKERRAQCQQ